MFLAVRKNQFSLKVVVVPLTAAVILFCAFEFVSRALAAGSGYSHSTSTGRTLGPNTPAPAITTYTWKPTVGTDWQLPANWDPVRVTPAASDSLVFDGILTPAPLVTNVPAEIIAELHLTGGALVTFNAANVPAGDKTLTISGAGLNLETGNSLTVAGGTVLTISVASGSTGTVGGQVTLQDAAHKIQAGDASGVTFQNGSIFTASTGFSGNPFGAGTDSSVVFASGSSSFFNSGSDPFGGSGHSISTFNLGSSQAFTAATAFSSDGRTYGNLTLDGSQTYSGSGANLLTVFNALTIAAGSTLTLSGTAGGDLNLLGDIAINGTLNQNGRTVKFQGGTATQNINTAATFGDVSISKIGGAVKLGGATTINGALQFNGSDSAVDVLDLNQNVLNLNGTVGGTSSSSSNGFKGDSTGATLNIGGTGALGTLRFVAGSTALKSLTVNRTTSGSVTLGSNLTVGSAVAGSLTLTDGVVDAGANSLSLAPFPSVTRTNGYVIGNVQKTFGGTGTFTFPVGTANGYSPIDANITAGTGNSLTVKAVQGKQPNITVPNALQRYWTISNSGSVTANLTFHYSASSPNDIVGTEANYKIFKYNGSFTQFTPDLTGVNSTQDHFATLNGVSSFADWTLADPALTVNTTDDLDDGACLNAHCSLREAISAANSSSDPNTINFNISGGDPGCTGGACTISLATALPSLATDMTISGPGANLLIVQRSTVGGTPNFRIFTINSGKTISISGLTITNGRLASANINNPDNGGGIYNQSGNLSLSNSTISGNSADYGGGIYSEGTLNITNSTFSGNSATVGSGGGIYNNSGTLSLTNSTFSGNSATSGFGGGILVGLTNATITNSTVTGNSAMSGGGIDHVSLTATIRNSIVALNAASTGPDLLGTFSSQGHNIVGSTSGATISPQTGDKFDAAASPLNLGPLANNGGPTFTHALLASSSAIDAGNSTLTTDQRGQPRPIDDQTVANAAGGNASDIGAYESHNLQVNSVDDTDDGACTALGIGNGCTLREAITAANLQPGPEVITFASALTSGGPVTITLTSALPDLSTPMTISGPGANLQISGNATVRVFNVTVTGAETVTLSGMAIMHGTRFYENSQPGFGGGIAHNGPGTLNITDIYLAGNRAIFGGGVANLSSGTLNVRNCALIDNSGARGGGIFNAAAGTVNVINTTISFNYVSDGTGTGGGAGIENETNGIINVTNSTLSYNRINFTGIGGGIHTYGGTVNIGNSIIALNTDAGGNPDVSGVFHSVGYNLIGKKDGGTGFANGVDGDQVGTTASPIDPLFGPVEDYGETTQTHPLLPGSPALNAGSNTLATNAGLTTDQRGLPRISNTTVDIGAYESRGFTIAATGGTPQSASILTTFSSSLVATVSSPFGEPVAGGVVTFTAPASGASGTFPGNVATANATINGSNIATAPVFTANGTAGGPYNVVASLAGSSPFANFALTNLKGTQAITVNTHAPVTASYNGQFTVAATASSGLAVSYGSSGACTNVGATFTMTSGTGTCTVQYDQAGNGNYNAAPQVAESVTAQKINQTITVNAHAPSTATYSSQFTVAATASSGLAVAYSSSGSCSNVGANFTITSGGGTCTVMFNQAGNSNYNAAPQVTESVTAQKANQTITVNTYAPATASYNGQFTVAATASSGLTVSYSSSGSCTNVGATFTMTSATGTCTVKYDQAGDTNYNAAPQVTESVTAQKANQTINFAGLSAKTFGDSDFGVSATGTSNLAVSFTASGQCTVTGSTVHLTGSGSCTITAKQAGDSNFNAAPDVPQTFNIAKAATTTGVSSSVNPSEFGQSVIFTATVTSGAGTPTGTVQFKDGVTDLGSPQTLNAGGVAQLTTSSLIAGLHTITANYNGDGNFLTSGSSLSGGQLVKAQPTLSVNDVSVAEGNSGTASAVFIVTLSAASGLAVNVNYATANGTATVADSDYQTTSGTLTFNPGDLTKTITVLVNGDQKFEPNETLLVNLTTPVNAAISDSQGQGTILNDDTLQLILDESGPDANQAAALESLLFVRDPFHVQSIAAWLDLGSDRNTRVIIFAANLQLNQGETASAVVVNLVDNNGAIYDVSAEDVRALPNSSFTQVRFRLPDNLAVGTCLVTVKAHGQTSNTGIIRIVN